MLLPQKPPIRSKASKALCFCLGYPIGRVLLDPLQRPLLFCYFKNNLFCLFLCRYRACYFSVTRHFCEEISSCGSARPAASAISRFLHRPSQQPSRLSPQQHFSFRIRSNIAIMYSPDILIPSRYFCSISGSSWLFLIISAQPRII